MVIYIVALALLILLIWLVYFWLTRIFRLYNQGKPKRKAFTIHLLLFALVVIIAGWYLRILPFSKNVYIMNQTENLTGEKFWSWKEYTYSDGSVRSEGYSLDIYRFNNSTASHFEYPDSSFFNSDPEVQISTSKWKPTPVSESELEVLEFVTPIYAGWGPKIIEKQTFIKEIATSPGSFYAYKDGNATNFFLLSPKRRLIIFIYHNM